jgi:hypothetical protein
VRKDNPVHDRTLAGTELRWTSRRAGLSKTATVSFSNRKANFPEVNSSGTGLAFGTGCMLSFEVNGDAKAVIETSFNAKHFKEA